MNNSYTQDHWLKAAKKDNYRARSVFKLKEIDAKYSLIRTGHRVLDIGAYPGSWSQYTSQQVGTTGIVYAVDTQKIVIDTKNIIPWQYDVTSQSFRTAIQPHSFDGILSDMAPVTTGIREADAASSERLFKYALSIVNGHLCTNGYTVIKYLYPQNLKRVKQQLAPLFDRVQIYKPVSSRNNSTEVFVIGIKHH